MNLDIKSILAKITVILLTLRRYATFIFIIAFLFVYTFLVWRINMLSHREPTEEAVTDKLKSVQRPSINKDTLSKIQDLQDQNVEVRSLFKQARDNPFSE